MNEVAPTKTINVHDRPWMNNDINQKRKDYRKCQQIWLKDNYEDNWNAVKEQEMPMSKAYNLKRKNTSVKKLWKPKVTLSSYTQLSMV